MRHFGAGILALKPLSLSASKLVFFLFVVTVTGEEAVVEGPFLWPFVSGEILPSLFLTGPSALQRRNMAEGERGERRERGEREAEIFSRPRLDLPRDVVLSEEDGEIKEGEENNNKGRIMRGQQHLSPLFRRESKGRAWVDGGVTLGGLPPGRRRSALAITTRSLLPTLHAEIRLLSLSGKSLLHTIRARR